MLHGERPLQAYVAPIADELAHPATTEIVINRPRVVGIEQNGVWAWRSVPEFTFDRRDQIGILADYLTGRDFDAESPYCGSTLPDDQRIQMCRPPATAPGIIAMAIGKPAVKARTLGDDDIPDLMSEINQPVSRASDNGMELCRLLDAGDHRAFLLCLRFVDITVSCARPAPGRFNITRIRFKAAKQVAA